MRNESPIEWALVVHAVAVAEFGPFAPLLIDTYPDAIRVAAAQGIGIDLIGERLKELIAGDMRRLVVRIPFDHYHLVARFYDIAGEVSQSNYDDGIELCGTVRPDEAGRFEPYMVREVSRERH